MLGLFARVGTWKSGRMELGREGEMLIESIESTPFWIPQE